MPTRVEFQKEMVLLHEEIIRMGAIVESSINDAMTALVELDVEKAQHVIAYDDVIDEMEREIDRHCVEIISRQQPVARDLRDVTSTLKLITDLERIADHASDICERVLAIADQPYRIPVPYDIVSITNAAKAMLRASLDSYVTRDESQAASVIKMDDRVDDLYNKIKLHLVHLMTIDPNNVAQLVDLLLICKYCERIADHAQNVAEWVLFYIRGRRVNNMDV